MSQRYPATLGGVPGEGYLIEEGEAPFLSYSGLFEPDSGADTTRLGRHFAQLADSIVFQGVLRQRHGPVEATANVFISGTSGRAYKLRGSGAPTIGSAEDVDD